MGSGNSEIEVTEDDARAMLGRVSAIDFSDIEVEPCFIDVNNHMNTGYYNVLFATAARRIFSLLVNSEASRPAIRQFSLWSTQWHHREIVIGDPLSFSFEIVEVTDKKIQYRLRMYHATEGWKAATYEALHIRVDPETRRSVPWPPEVRRLLDLMNAVAERPNDDPLPGGVPAGGKAASKSPARAG